MSIVRVGLAETKNFSEGYDAIFGKKRGKSETKKGRNGARSGAAKKKPAKKK